VSRDTDHAAFGSLSSPG